MMPSAVLLQGIPRIDLFAIRDGYRKDLRPTKGARDRDGTVSINDVVLTIETFSHKDGFAPRMTPRARLMHQAFRVCDSCGPRPSRLQAGKRHSKALHTRI